MLLDLHIEGSAPVTLLVRDESRSTRSTSGNLEDEKSVDGNSAENLTPLETKPKRKTHKVQQGHGNAVADDSYDNSVVNQGKKVRTKKHRKQFKETSPDDVEAGEGIGKSMSVSSSKSSLGFEQSIFLIGFVTFLDTKLFRSSLSMKNDKISRGISTDTTYNITLLHV